MKTRIAAFVLGAGILSAAAPLLAHHSFAAEFDGIHVVHLGDYADGLTAEQIGELPGCDIALVPVGGGLSPQAASRLISQMEPKIVIPMPIVDDASRASAAIKAFCKEQGLASPPPAQPKLAISISALPEETTTVIIEARAEGLGGAEPTASGTLGLA